MSKQLVSQDIIDIIYKIRGASYEVYNNIGYGVLESIYQEAMTYELRSMGLQVDREFPVPVKYKWVELKAPLKIDLLVNKKFIIELKSVKALDKPHFKQLYTYLKLTGYQAGILINFHTMDLKKDTHILTHPDFRLPDRMTYTINASNNFKQS